MRISVTDRCNLHCKYCMPYGVGCVPRWDTLSLEKIRAMGICATSLGVHHIEVTRGGPSMRRNCCQLVKQLKSTPGIKRVAITINGILLERYLDDLTKAGINDINISFDTPDRDLCQRIAGTDALGAMTEAVRRACAMSLSVKINAVSIDFSWMDEEHRETGQDSWRQMVELVREYPVGVQFIEMIPIGYDRSFKTVSYWELLEEVMKAYPCIEEDDRVHGFGSAVYYRVPGSKGNIGLISAIHGKSCSGCNRIHLASQGCLKPCLCYEDGMDLRQILRKGQERPKGEGHHQWPYAGCPSGGEFQRGLRKAMEQAVLRKPAAHCFERPGQVAEAHNMIAIEG